MPIVRVPIAGASPAENLRASLLMITSVACFMINDTIVKFVMQDMAPAQVMAVRGVMIAIFIFSIGWWKNALPAPRLLLNKYLLIRAFGDSLTTLLYMIALAHLPLANTTAIYQALPLAVTVGAALFLRESVGWRRWSATAVGFIGVVIIVRPGLEGFTMYSVFVLLSVLVSAIRDLVVHKLPKELSSLSVAGVTSTAIALTGAAFLPFTGTTPISNPTYGLLFAAALLMGTANILMVAALRIGDMGFVAPLRYASLIFAAILGYLVFGDVPGKWEIIGSMIIVASGLYTFSRERRRNRLILARTQAH
ncbi:DMT family transporter [Aureimonas fodinaquatilis]|uniref:DMT family transporter n=1 Tax=Aureimonas fodinaquatilis TaxID=2565783 RepID=A0A5B0DTP8_9HYPH|nr:DMT family transporter [Aureimonas fodinaquatilis]KAA0970187.1 DMT family transporter [Aureimonas fodinaquatilis]